MLKRVFLKIWKDPVWSKVIAAIILGLGVLGLNAISAVHKDISFKEELVRFWKSRYDLWHYCLFSLAVISIWMLIKNKRKGFFRYNDETIEIDRALFAKIRSQLPSDKMAWVKGHGYSNNPFKMEEIDLLNFIEEKDRADFEFLHPELENLKKELVSGLEGLNEVLIRNIFGAGDNWLSIPREWSIEKFQEARECIEAESDIVGEAYDDFIKTGRRILRVS
jgi:hypothetical protein